MARGQEKEDSVYDFLYIDSRRLALFLSQFSQYGHLTALTRSVAETASASGGLSVHIAKLDSASSEQTTQSRQFDPQWMAPLSFLDQANQRGMISRGLDDARIGKLTLIAGALALFDLSIIQSAWGLDYVKSILQSSYDAANDGQPTGNRHERRSAAKPGKSGPNAFDAALALLKTMPHAVLATVQAGEYSAWSSLQQDGLLISASDLMVKHGCSIAGHWTMVGVVDALPDDPVVEVSVASQLRAAETLGSLGAVIGGIAPAARGMLGRPKEAYGMTPLLIFREVSG